MRRKRVVAVVGALTVSALFVTSYVWVRQAVGYSITPTTLARIENGMTRDDVRRVVGWTPSLERTTVLVWQGTNGQLAVHLDAEGHVFWTEFAPEPDAWVMRLWNQLGLPKLP